MPLRPVLLAIASSALMFSATTAQADPMSKPACTENCVDAGYEWAEKNSLSGPEDCASDNADFTAGCTHYLEEKQQASEPALEEPAPVAEATEAGSADAPTAADEVEASDADEEAEASAGAAPTNPPQD